MRRPRTFTLVCRAVAWMGVLALAFYSLSPPALRDAAGGENGLPGQVNHALAYLVTALALRWAYPQSSPQRTILLLYGCVLELLQTFVPGRSPKVMDAVSSGVGATMGAAVGRSFLDLVIRRARQSRSRLRHKGG